MNKTKLQQLVDQAVALANDELKNTDPARWYSDQEPRQELIMEKFAELILQQCVKLCEDGDATQTTAGGAAQAIQQYFS